MHSNFYIRARKLRVLGFINVHLECSYGHSEMLEGLPIIHRLLFNVVTKTGE